MTFNTGNPIGSTDARDRLDNSENMDILENSTTLNAHADRLGTMRKTRKGMELEHDNQISAHEAEHDNQMLSFENDFDGRLAGMAFTRVGTFTAGATLTDMRQTLIWELSHGGDGREYGWVGSFLPSGKVVAAGSTPATSGGIGAGAWVDRTDGRLRSDLQAVDGDSLVGYATYAQIRAYTGDLKSIRCGGRSSLYSGDGSHGKFYRDDSDTTSTDNDGTILIDALGRRWKRKRAGKLNAAWFGYNIQAAVSAMPSTGGHVFLPDHAYSLSTAVTITQKIGFIIEGESREGVVITQNTDNTPIFKFTKENTHSFRISNMTGLWATQQTISNTAACVFYSDCDTLTGSYVYNGTIDNITCDYGYRCISTNKSTATTFWSLSIDKIYQKSHMVGAAVGIEPTTGGSPVFDIGAVYCRADSAQESLMIFKACDSVVIRNLEANVCTRDIALVKATAGSTVKVNALRQESFTLPSAASNTGYVQCSDSDITIDHYVISTTTVSNAVKNYIVRILSGSADASIKVGYIDFTGLTITSGSIYAASGASESQKYISFGVIMNLSKVTALTDVDATATANGVWVESWNQNKLVDIGDADAMITIGTTAKTLVWGSTLTANRVCTMPPAYNPSNAYNGLTYRIVRNASMPGAFDLTIKTSTGGTITTIPSGYKGYVDLTYKRNAWVVTFSYMTT